MDTHFNILIDASGSMGDFKGKDGANYLLPDKSTRTDLVKKILINSILPKLNFVDFLNVRAFRKPLKMNIQNEYVPDNTKSIFIELYNDVYKQDEIINSISTIQNPEISGTPLFNAILSIIGSIKKNNINIIILSDGDASDQENFDVEILKRLEITNKKCKIYFIGIAQNEKAQKKSKNLAEKTNGFYVNINAINYEEAVFENMLFEFNATITSNALKDNIEQPKPLSIQQSKIIEKINHSTVEEIESQNVNSEQELDIKQQVDSNTQSLKLISSQLDTIVKEISFIRKGKTNEDENEFETNEDEERNRIIGYDCEKHLNSIFLNNKWENVDWLNEINEQGKPYDFEVNVNSINYYIECKGSASNSNEFYLTKNEWLFYLANRKYYRLYFVSEINSQNPTIHRIEDLLKDMEEGKLIPCSNVNRKVKADRILFQIIK